MIYAVIDTNVLVSAILTNNLQSPTLLIMEAMLARRIIPLYNEEILSEYAEVLHRPKFGFADNAINLYIDAIKKEGMSSQRMTSSENFPDPKDVVFYEVALSKEDAYLVTGNTKHFPKTPIVVTPAEMLEILKKEGIL